MVKLLSTYFLRVAKLVNSATWLGASTQTLLCGNNKRIREISNRKKENQQKTFRFPYTKLFSNNVFHIKV